MFTEKETADLMKEMRRGYSFVEKNNDKTIDIWYPIWEKFVEENRKTGSRNFLACLDSKTNSRTYVSFGNWIGDLEMAFLNSGRGKAREREIFCTTMLGEFQRCWSTGDIDQNLAELYYLLGKREEGDALFEKMLEEYPEDVYLWADYAREYGGRHGDDNERAYTIYKRGIDAVLAECAKQPELDLRHYRDIDLLYDEIAEVCTILGKTEEADEWLEKSRAISRSAEDHYTTVTEAPDFSCEPLKQQPIIAPPKVGRNDPCPCGSGKKYKKCCLNKAD